MTYLVAYELGGERHFATKRSIHGNDLCRLFTSKRDAEQARADLAALPCVTAAYVISMGR